MKLAAQVDTMMVAMIVRAMLMAQKQVAHGGFAFEKAKQSAMRRHLLTVKVVQMVFMTVAIIAVVGHQMVYQAARRNFALKKAKQNARTTVARMKK